MIIIIIILYFRKRKKDYNAYWRIRSNDKVCVENAKLACPAAVSAASILITTTRGNDAPDQFPHRLPGCRPAPMPLKATT